MNKTRLIFTATVLAITEIPLGAIAQSSRTSRGGNVLAERLDFPPMPSPEQREKQKFVAITGRRSSPLKFNRKKSPGSTRRKSLPFTRRF